MTDHRFEPVCIGGCYFSGCSCGWAGGVYSTRLDAKRAHIAHVMGRPVPEPLRPQVLIAPRALD